LSRITEEQYIYQGLHATLQDSSHSLKKRSEVLLTLRRCDFKLIYYYLVLFAVHVWNTHGFLHLPSPRDATALRLKINISSSSSSSSSSSNIRDCGIMVLSAPPQVKARGKGAEYER
jgi:hypothetical protein